MRKQLAVAIMLSVSMLALPAVALARHGSDDSSGHGSREDKITGSSNATGTVLSQTSTVPSANDSTTTPTDQQTTLTIKEAIAAAEKQFPGKTIVRVQKESEHGVNVWRVRFSDGSRVDVDASTGEIITTKNHEDKDDSGHYSPEDD